MARLLLLAAPRVAVPSTLLLPSRPSWAVLAVLLVLPLAPSVASSTLSPVVAKLLAVLLAVLPAVLLEPRPQRVPVSLVSLPLLAKVPLLVSLPPPTMAPSP